MPYSGDNERTTDVRYSKTDGVMNYYYRAITDPQGEVLDSVIIVRSGYNPNPSYPLGIDPILLLTLGGVGAIIVVLVIIIRKR